MYFSFKGSKEEDFRLPYLSHQQLPAGILPMVPEVAQAVGACQGSQAKDYSRVMPNPGKATMTAMIANELLYAGTSLTAETILKNKSTMNQLPLGPLTRPSEQLGYLAAVQGLQVTEHFLFSRNHQSPFDFNQTVNKKVNIVLFSCRLNIKIFPKTTRMSLCP